MTGRHLGEFELMVLLAVLQRPEDAYAVTIAQEIRQRLGRTTSRGALYVTLKRLEEKGLLTSSFAESDRKRAGRRRRYYRATPGGVEAVARARAAIEAMARGLEPLPGA